jgi:hypothetical protein
LHTQGVTSYTESTLKRLPAGQISVLQDWPTGKIGGPL